MEIGLPYGNDRIRVHIPDQNFLQVVEPNELKPRAGTREIIKNAISVGKGLSVEKGDRVAIVVDDKTRPCPTKEMLPVIIGELSSMGISKENVIIIIANGAHEPANMKDVESILGKLAEYGWINHDAKNSEFIDCGETSFGTPVLINEIYMNADVKILLGDAELHYFAGYGGGRKSVLPGIAAHDTIQVNHKRMFQDGAIFGKLDGNPVHEDMDEAAGLAGVDFCLNVVQNGRHQIVEAFAGDFREVLVKGARVIDEMYKVKVGDMADVAIVAADGSPHDINLYQAMKALQTVIDVVKEGGAIILVAECRDGHGSETFYRQIGEYVSSEEVKNDLLKEFIMGKHKVYYMLKALEKVDVFMVTNMPAEMVEHFGMAKVSMDEAVKKSLDLVGRDAKILVSPHGVTTLANKEMRK